MALLTKQMSCKPTSRPLADKPATTGAGLGIGLRSQHAAEFIEKKPALDWLEILADNYLDAGGVEHRHLQRIREDYPFALHSVGMSIGGSAKLDRDYLRQLKALGERYACQDFSDHLCFTSVGESQMHDLLPLPRNEETIRHVAQRIRDIQDFLGQSILVENVSCYLQYKNSDIDEAGFLNAVCTEADCGLLLDLNNLYVNQQNHGLMAAEIIAGIDRRHIREIHLGGFEDCGHYLLDAHNHPVADPVWDLYETLIQELPQVASLIEWDNDLPPLSKLLAEANKARCLSERSGGADIRRKSAPS